MAGLIQLNPTLDVGSLAREFAANRLLQVREVLTDESARRVQSILVEQTPWGLAVQSGALSQAKHFRAEELAGMSADEVAALRPRETPGSATDYAFAYHSYPMVTAYLERWNPGSLQDRLLEELNGTEVLDFVRAVTGIPEIVKMDGQATLYAPGDFLSAHSDAESERGRRVAYVLNLTVGEWKPRWGGYLNFFTDDWDIERAIRPRFNCLNLFSVPRWHSVGEVNRDAPLARYAITGWARDR